MSDRHGAHWLVAPLSLLKEIAGCVVCTSAAHDGEGRTLNYSLCVSVTCLRPLFHGVAKRTRGVADDGRELGTCHLILRWLSEIFGRV